MKRHVALVGFMGSGKSTIGRKLARRLGCAFVDTDVLVARDHGPVPAIFAQEGEAAFRRYEQAAIRGALDSAAPAVLALGGGALTTATNRSLLAARAYRVFIRVSAEQVLARLRKAKEARPLLGETPTLAAIQALYDKRMPQYETADHVVRADRLSGRQVLDDILEWLRRSRITLERS
jgi:shikimate kinase